jgi:membrane-bound serine protease (ClpP class)
MDDIINEILASPIPVIVWVGPEGARAASAGMYITYAAHVASMAPVTNIGSATPIQAGTEGAAEGEETALDKKVVNDAVARIRELALLRGRNADWGEAAVREAENVGSSEAVELNIVDFIADDIADVLNQADGMLVQVSGGEATVDTAGAEVRDVEMSFFERLLQIIVDPNIAFVLLSLGTLGLIFELSNPGAILPGVAGALMMVTGFYALGTLDSNWTGFILIAFAFVLFVLEVFVASSGILAVGGTLSFLLGGLLLSNTNNPEVLQISRWVIFTVTACLGLFFLFVVGSVARTRKQRPAMGQSAMIGMTGEARTDLDPDGMIFLFGELWNAHSESGPLMKREQVTVTNVKGLRVTVRRAGETVTQAAPESGTLFAPPEAPQTSRLKAD